jgi:hypothetical protein
LPGRQEIAPLFAWPPHSSSAHDALTTMGEWSSAISIDHL